MGLGAKAKTDLSVKSHHIRNLGHNWQCIALGFTEVLFLQRILTEYLVASNVCEHRYFSHVTITSHSEDTLNAIDEGVNRKVQRLAYRVIDGFLEDGLNLQVTFSRNVENRDGNFITSSGRRPKFQERTVLVWYPSRTPKKTHVPEPSLNGGNHVQPTISCFLQSSSRRLDVAKESIMWKIGVVTAFVVQAHVPK